MSTSMDSLVTRLSAASVRTAAPPIDWPETVDIEQWFMTPELISLHGTPYWDALDEPAQKRLSFFEAVNFFSLNIYGEKPLVSGIADRLYAPEFAAVSPYLHHFLGEENRHMEYFGRFCQTYARKIYPEKRFSFPRDTAQGEDAILFFAQTQIFEIIVDRYNEINAADGRVMPLARTINRLHHKDEIRHLVFGRKLLQMLWDIHKKEWEAATINAVRGEILSFIEATWRQYYNPDVYHDAGIRDPYGAMDAAWASPAHRAFRARIDSEIRSVLSRAGILEEEVVQ